MKEKIQGERMKEYIRFFRIPFIVVGVMAVITLAAFIANGSEEVETVASTNTERLTTERVFDYADVMTDEEEAALREQIAEAESATQCDIVVVTLNQSLVEYAAQYESIIGPVDTSECVMVFADNFYDENMFGYDEPYGDGVLFLDNWYREADGKIYSWMSTCGRAEWTYSSTMIDRLLDDSLAYVDDSPYEAYSMMVERFEEDMLGDDISYTMDDVFDPLVLGGISFVIALIFLLVNWRSKKGKRTVDQRTYVDGSPFMKRRGDHFLYKNVTKTKIETSSSSGGGGGGHHVSSGGHSHGGGGHSR